MRHALELRLSHYRAWDKYQKFIPGGERTAMRAIPHDTVRCRASAMCAYRWKATAWMVICWPARPVHAASPFMLAVKPEAVLPAATKPPLNVEAA
jgi:hypothetical protein